MNADEARTRAIVEAALDCIITMDHEGKVVEFNPAAERTFGYRREEVIGQEMAQLIIPSSLRDRHRAGLAHYLATGEGPLLGTRLEIDAIRADGRQLPVELTITRLPSDGPPLFTGFVRDITERRQAERRLAVQYAVSRVIAEVTAVNEMAQQVLAAIGQAMDWEVGAFWRIDAQQQVLRCETLWHSTVTNDAEFGAATYAAVFAPGIGLPGRVWASGQAVWEPDVLALPNFPRCHAAHAQGLHTALGFPIRSGNEVQGVIEFFIRETRPPDTELLQVVEGIGSQMGEFLQRRHAEEALKEREAHLRLALDAARMGIWQWNVQAGELRWSGQLEPIHGVAPGTFDGKFETFLGIIHPDDRENVTSRIQEALGSGKEFATEYRVLYPDGAIHWVAGEGSVFRDEAGRPVQMVGMAMDITERKRSEQELQTRAEQEALLNRIGAALRGSTDPAMIQDAAMTALGEALAVDRCYFARYDLARDRVVVGADWHRSDLPSLCGEYRISGFDLDPQGLYAPDAPLVIRDVRADAHLSPTAARILEGLGLRAGMGVGLFEGGRLVASLSVATAETPRQWTQQEVRLVEAVAAQTRAAMEAARIREREHNIAERLQEALRPALPGKIPGLDVADYYQPALDEAEIGGDFFDVFALEKGCFVFVVADLSGKGLAAASQVATVRHMLRTLLYDRQATIAEAVTRLNAMLVDHDLLTGFATLFVGTYDANARTLTYVSCGQEPGLILRKATGDVEELGPTGPVLGGFPSASYVEQAVPLASGDVIGLFTDGLTEAGPNRKDLLGISGVLSVFRESVKDATSAQEITAQVMAGVEAVATAGGVRDDVCLLVVCVE